MATSDLEPLALDVGVALGVGDGFRVLLADAGESVTAVAAPELACEYVDRELLVQRTTSPVCWDDGASNRGGGTRLDVLLADRDDRTRSWPSAS
jgi:hypothetical protein